MTLEVDPECRITEAGCRGGSNLSDMAELKATLENLRLVSFKSFRNQHLSIDPFTILVGRNGSGKSNALDGLWVLSQLAVGSDIRESLDGGREGPEVRGGALGCAPTGDDRFTLGCDVRSARGQTISYEVTIQVDPIVQVVHERLWTKRQTGNQRGQDRDILKTDAADANRSDIVARWNNQKQGLNPPIDFRASQLVISQASTRVPATSAAGREVQELCAQVLAALKAVFVLDPVPHQMRQYVRRKDNRLRRSADNLSATVAELIRDPPTRNRILSMIQALNESDVDDIGVAESQLEDVMLTVLEVFDGNSWPVPARQMSDGTLRFLALIAALLDVPLAGSRVEGPDVPAQTTLVIEELENGLHPSQAARIVNLLREEAERRDVRLVATTHSPAILDALPGEMHNSVVVCWRDPGTSRSRLCRLPALDTYLDVVTSGTLGQAAIADELRSRTKPPTAARAALDELFSA